MSMLVQQLFEGPLDVVGDIHGEIEALTSLLDHLGYRDGLHPAGRRLVFLGDLCDRGPDSPAVIRLVRGLVENGLAQCILGNHELNVLRNDAKHGNRWIIAPDHHENRNEFRCQTVGAEERKSIESFFCALPLALERKDLRIVHAAWDDAAITEVRALSSTNIDAFTQFESASKAELEALQARAEMESAPYQDRLEDENFVEMPLLTATGHYEQQRQMLNPIRVLTSGLERATSRQFFATCKWRFCDRVKWWNDYSSTVPVVFGHYWRGNKESEDISGGKPDLFEGIQPGTWLGPHMNAYCVDFSVGGRFRERLQRAKAPRIDNPPFASRLAAVRWPEREVLFDDGLFVAAC